MRWRTVLIATAASGWFFPVSCTTSLYAGVRVVSALDARQASDGDSIHSGFSYVVETGNADEPFAVGDLPSLARYKQLQDDPGLAGPVSFLMSRRVGRLDLDDSTYSYEVIEDGDAGQIIEVVEAYHDGDNTIWSRYQATRTSITPISTRMMYFGYLFPVFPFALGTGFLIFGFGRYFRATQRAALGAA